MLVKTSELIGPGLNWAVATCLGHECAISISGDVVIRRGNVVDYFAPSTDWSWGGPLITSNDISFRKYHKPASPTHGTFYAMVCRESGSQIHWHKSRSSQGPTALIAGMRCLVTSKSGDTVEIPQELIV